MKTESSADYCQYHTSQKIKSLDQVSVGDFLYTGTYTDAGLPNIMRVDRKSDAGDRIYGVFVDPKDYTKQRRADDFEFCVWDFIFAKGNYRRAAS